MPTKPRSRRKPKADYDGVPPVTDPNPFFATITTWDGAIFQVLVPVTDEWGNPLFTPDWLPIVAFDADATGAAADAWVVVHPYPGA